MLTQFNEVTLQRDRLVLGWVTVHGTKPSQLGQLSLLPAVECKMSTGGGYGHHSCVTVGPVVSTAGILP